MTRATVTGEMFTAHSRSQIVQAVAARKKWRGTRRGIKVRIDLSAQPDLDNRRVSWSAEIGGVWIEGKATHTTEALQQIDAARKTQA